MIIAMAIIGAAIALIIIIVIVVCCCKKLLKGKLTLQTMTSTNKDDEKPLNELIDSEKVSTSDVTPGAISLSAYI